MARKKGHMCGATKSQKRELRRCEHTFGKHSKKCKNMKKDIC